MPDYATYRDIFAGRRLPLAYVDLDLMEANIKAIARRANGKKIRIASKSIRCRSLMERILAHGAPFEGIMSFTAEEALWLLNNRLDNILIAYPTVHIPDIQALATKVRDGAKVWLMADCAKHIDIIDEALNGSDIRMPVCVDIDMSVDLPGLHFGVWRSSIRSMDDLKRFTERALRSDAVKLSALMGYEAQIAGVGDNAEGKPVMNQVIRGLKSWSVPKIAQFRAEAVDWLKECGVKPALVNGGGTGSMDTTCQEEAVTEVTVGSGFFSPHLFDNYDDFRYAPAAGFAVPVTRHPKKDTFTCLGGGYIASGAVGPDKAPRPYLPEGCSLTNLEGAGEVQTPVVHKGNSGLSIGDPVFMRHSKAGELCERFNELHLVRKDGVSEIVPTYRGEGKCFL